MIFHIVHTYKLQATIQLLLAKQQIHKFRTYIQNVKTSCIILQLILFEFLYRLNKISSKKTTPIQILYFRLDEILQKTRISFTCLEQLEKCSVQTHEIDRKIIIRCVFLLVTLFQRVLLLISTSSLNIILLAQFKTSLCLLISKSPLC